MSKLKDIRVQLAMSQRDLAKASGVAMATICRLERGKHKPTHVTRRKLSAALNVTPAELQF